ncbi:MAG: PIN-like domain-containing protein, partial [Ignavibacteria bacterium]|nr:PIN-like domain-containing protein [Ignavibacteria bacterium]
PIKEQLADLLENRIGDCFTEQELNSIYAEGEKRYLLSVPPGYKDKSKPVPDRYGDLVLWKEVLKKNSQIDQPIILVTGDTKEDWYYEELGLTIGPRPELIDEFSRVKPNLFYVYPANQFLTFAAQYLETEIDNKSIVEIDEFIKLGRSIEQTQSVAVDNLTENTTILLNKESISSCTDINPNNPEQTNSP